MLEVLVVISILVILVSMIAVGLSQAKRKVNITHCAGNLKQLVLGARMYAGDNKERLPRIGIDNIQTKEGANRDLLKAFLVGYVDCDECFVCRAERRADMKKAYGSYDWNRFWNEKLIDSQQEARNMIPLIMDKEAWHGFKNVVYLDGRVERGNTSLNGN